MSPSELEKKLDDLVAQVRAEANAEIALVFVITKDGGVSFTLQGDTTLVPDIPGMLVHVAETIYQDYTKKAGVREH